MNDISQRATDDPSHPAIAALTAAEIAGLLLPPDRVGVPSSWWGHVPFGHWLVHELKPRLLVCDLLALSTTFLEVRFLVSRNTRPAPRMVRSSS